MKRRFFLWLLLAGVVSGAAWAPAVPPTQLKTVPDGGDQWVPLANLAVHYGMGRPYEAGAFIAMRNSAHTLRFDPGSQRMFCDGVQVYLHAPVRTVRGRISVSQTDLLAVLDPLMNPADYLQNRQARVIVLDPGHGGLDRGGEGRRGLDEKWVVMEVSKRARAILVNAGYRVYLTRQSDRFLDLDERCRRAALWGADAFVSIHLNAATSREAIGPETWVMTAAGYSSTSGRRGNRIPVSVFPGNRHDKANTLLGYCLQKAMLQVKGGEDRGLRRSRFAVLRNAPCPAALVELDFVSNLSQEKLMTDSMYREKMAQAVAKGIMDYMADVRRSRLLAP